MAKIFRNGKYRGKKVEWVRIYAHSYYQWAIRNAPNLIIDDSIPDFYIKQSKLPPNLNFDNESYRN